MRSQEVGPAGSSISTRAKAEGISARVVSLSSWELFRELNDPQRAQVLPPGVPTVAVEAGATLGWLEFADAVVGLDRFGTSAPGDVAYQRLGVTADAVAERVRELVTGGSR